MTAAKDKLEKMKGTKTLVESLTDTGKKKQYLKSENKQLRDQLKAMSDNVNLLIEKMNQETLRKRKYLNAGPAGATSTQSRSSRGSTRIRAADQEIVNTDKAV